jgi:hypothetical protein
VLAVRGERWGLKCNECPVQLDLAPARMPKDNMRLPTGWLDLGDGAHACPNCAPRWLEPMMRAMRVQAR